MPDAGCRLVHGNVVGVAPPGDLVLEDWLDTRACNSYDIYVLGFQEMVLNARNVLGPKNSSISSKWNIGDALNNTGRRRQQEEELAPTCTMS
ncbi:hypothetical protein QYE76_008032 [Lolium multiflorum]|uniref:Uncharacterized protein n=1 Tax=Lolium multiflorum TaxID=4521 RepID=A0AAD8QFH6_LOLMU|nr:hypothetical protein QYE76_008032 [Lolium multiflorum]